MVASRPDLVDVLAVQPTTPARILLGMKLLVEISSRKVGVTGSMHWMLVQGIQRQEGPKR